MWGWLTGPFPGWVWNGSVYPEASRDQREGTDQDHSESKALEGKSSGPDSHQLTSDPKKLQREGDKYLQSSYHVHSNHEECFTQGFTAS